MNFCYRTIAACCCLMGATAAHAAECGKASSPIETAVCRDANLGRLDADLNRLYQGLRSQLTPKLKLELLEQQRAWLKERNRNCPAGEVVCLTKQYGDRIHQLQALQAGAEAADDRLTQITALVIKGSWKAMSVVDPQGSGKQDDAAIRESLISADLPQLGAVVNLLPGKACVPPNACRVMAWTRKPLANVEGGKAISRNLGLSPTTPVLSGSTGAKSSPGFLLVPRGDGNVWAIFGLCGPNATNCRDAAENWAPVSQVTLP